jgi:hypothetical protein
MASGTRSVSMRSLPLAAWFITCRNASVSTSQDGMPPDLGLPEANPSTQRDTAKCRPNFALDGTTNLKLLLHVNPPACR